MTELFTRYWLIGILCTITCKALFLYTPANLIASREPDLKAFISPTTHVDDCDDWKNCVRVERKSLKSLNCLTVWENEETEEDEKSDGGFQHQSFVQPQGSARITDLFGISHHVVVIPLFVLFHSWKSFLF